MDLIDRDEERRRLMRAADEPPQLVIVRGRRRVGKSYLLAHAFAGRRLLYVQADEQDERGHLRLLAAEAADLLEGRPPLRFDDWDAVLAFLGEQASREPLVVALDEFQWLWQAQPALDSLIQRHWDRWQRRRVPITLVLCGSSLVHMERLLAPERPLFGRADYRPVLMPLDYRSAAGFAASDDPEELLRRYAVLGGTPQYQVWAGDGPIRDVIADRVLRKGESLYEEPLHLLREEREIRAAGSYFDVMRAVAAGATRVNEIAQQTASTTPHLVPRLARLVSLGYLHVHAPLEPTGFVVKRGSYRIADPFFRFWFRYVFPNRSRLERGRVTDVMRLVADDQDNYMGLPFEETCRHWVGAYAQGLAPAGEVGGWWSRSGTSEIDLVTTARGRYTLVGSCKWGAKVKADAVADLRRQAAALGPKAAAADLVLFVRGATADLRRLAGREAVRLVTPADLFA